MRLSQAEKRQQVADRLQEQAIWAEFRASYPLRLLNLVFEYSNRPELDARKDVDSDSFVFSRPREMNAKWFPVELSLEYNYELILSMDEAEYQVSELVEAEKEAQRVYALRQQALSKLSAEERAALNL